MPITPIPYERLTINSDFSTEEIRTRLNAQVSEGGTFSSRRMIFGKIEKPYVGKLEADSFQIVRVTRYKNSFRPVVTGQIVDKLDRREVELRMHPHIAILLLLLLFLFGALLPSMGVFFRAFIDSGVGEAISQVNIPVGLIVFIYVVMVVSYNFEAVKIKRFLRELLESQEDSIGRA